MRHARVQADRHNQARWSTHWLMWLAWLAVSLPTFARDDVPLVSLDEFPRSTLTIETPDARRHVITVWIADTPARSQQGLMGVRALPDHTGMLFLFDHPQVVAMWMKNTPLPLDMLFIDANGRVTSLIANTTPMSETILPSRGKVIGVLELKGGAAKAMRIPVGAIVRHAAFGTVPGTR